MFKIRIFSILLLSASALSAGAAEIKLPLKMENVSASLKDHAPEHVSVSANGETLTINITEVGRKGGFDKTHSLNLKRAAGRTVTILLDVKTDKVSHSSNRIPNVVGKITFGGTTQNLVAGRAAWHTCVFKNVKIPGNGLLKMRITLKNLSGEIQIRNPRIRGDLPKVRGTGVKKKKKKKSKD